MFHERLGFRPRGLALVLIGALATGACSDDPVGLDDHDHAVEGIQLLVNGAVVAELDADADAWTGELEVDVGGETGTIEVRLLDHDGDEIAPDDDLYLEATVGDGGVAVFVQGGAGAFSGVLQGVAPGTTVLELTVHHGVIGSGHPVFVATPAVEVIVG